MFLMVIKTRFKMLNSQFIKAPSVNSNNYSSRLEYIRAKIANLRHEGRRGEGPLGSFKLLSSDGGVFNPKLTGAESEFCLDAILYRGNKYEYKEHDISEMVSKLKVDYATYKEMYHMVLELLRDHSFRIQCSNTSYSWLDVPNIFNIKGKTVYFPIHYCEWMAKSINTSEYIYPRDHPSKPVLATPEEQFVAVMNKFFLKTKRMLDNWKEIFDKNYDAGLR